MEDTGSRTEADDGRHERIRAALHGPHHDPYEGYEPDQLDEPSDWMVAVMDDEPEERP